MDSTLKPAVPPTSPPSKSPISLNLILVVITFVSLIFTGYFIYQNRLLQKRLAAIETSQLPNLESTEQDELTCNSDSDCVVALNINTCCGCPTAINKNSLNENGWVSYEKGKDYSQTTSPQCKDAYCAACVLPSDVKPICEKNLCKLPQTSDETANWKTYTNTKYNFSFKYPSEYSFDESEGLVSILSPLSQVNRSGGFSVKEDELKIEIWISLSPTGDILEKFVNEEIKKNTEGFGSLLKESETEISGTKAVYQEWSGMGENSVIFLIKNGHRFAIAKYPLTTSRQNEYDQILSTFRFIECGGPEKIRCLSSKACKLFENYSANPNSYGSCVSESEIQP